MDVVRLQIVYDTNQAATKLNGLNRQLTNLNSSTRTSASAVVGLAQAFSTGDISAVALTNRLSYLGGKLGTVGIGLATATGLLVTFRNIADKAREKANKLADQMRNIRRASDELLRGDIRSPLQTQIENITDAIRELDRTLAVQRMGILERIGINPTLKRGRDDVISKAIMQFIKGGANPDLVKQRGALAGERAELTPERFAGALNARALAQQNRISAFSSLTRGTAAGAAADKLAVLEKELEGLLEVLPETSDEVQSVARQVNEYTDALRRELRAERLMTSALETTADALEDFVITGTVAFTDFLNNILRLLYRDFTGELIHGIVRGAVGGPGPVGVSGAGQDAGDKVPGQPSGSIQSNVNFHVNAIDAQGVASFLNTHGAAIAATVTQKASRASGMRRVFRRG